MAPPRKTHCSRGHEFTPENTYLHQQAGRANPTRRCATCQKMAHTRWAQKQPKKERKRNDFCSQGHAFAEHGYTRPNGTRECRLCTNARESLRLKGTLKGRERHLMTSFGITTEDYNSMHENQNGLCAICHQPEPRGLRVDHDHQTKKIRALLCHHCNVALGHFKDNSELLKRAAEYLEAHEMIAELI